MDVYDYIKKYKDYSFEEREMNEIDILLFSQLSYVSYVNIDFSKSREYFLKDIVSLIDRDKVKEFIYAQNKALVLLELMSNTKRYSEIKLFNYKYEAINDAQFGAITLKLPDGRIIVSFEGTDNMIIGWKEDAILSYKYPTFSQKEAGKYLNSLLSQVRGKIIVCGHSKGGNLALTGTMRTSFFKRFRIKDIYSFDGPGLKESEFYSLEYKIVKRRLKNIVPEQSIVGILFMQENLDVVKSTYRGPMQHAATSWVIDENVLVRSSLCKTSRDLDAAISRWFLKCNYEQREKLVTDVFRIFEDADIEKVSDITDNKVKSVISIVKGSKKLDAETKNMIYSFLKIFMSDVGFVYISDEFSKLKDKVKSFFNK